MNPDFTELGVGYAEGTAAPLVPAVTARTGLRATDRQPAARALDVMRFGPQPHDFAAEVCGL